MHRRPPIAHGLEGIRLMAWVLVVILLILVKVTAMEPVNWAKSGHLADEISDGISTAADSLLGGVNNAGSAGRATLGEGSRSRPTSTGVRNEMARPSSFGHSYAGSPASARYHHRHASGSTYSRSSLPPLPGAGAKRPFDEGGSSSALRSVHQRPAAPSQPLRADSRLYSDTRAYLSAHPPSLELVKQVIDQFAQVRDKITQVTGPFPQSLKIYYDRLLSIDKSLFSGLNRQELPNREVFYAHSDVFAKQKHYDAVLEHPLPFSTLGERRVVELLLLEHLSHYAGGQARLIGPIFIIPSRKISPSREVEKSLEPLFRWENFVVERPPFVTLDDFDINEFRIEFGPRLDYPGSPYAGLPLYPCRAVRRAQLGQPPIEVGFVHYPLDEDVGRRLVRPPSERHGDKDTAMPIDDKGR